MKTDSTNREFTGQLDYETRVYCDTTRPSYYYQRGVAFYNLRQYEKSVAIYTAGIKKFPTNSMILSFRGNAFLSLDNYMNAVADYREAIKYQDNVIDEIELNKEHTQYDNKDIERSKKIFVSDMQMHMAKAKFAQGLYPDALTDIRNAINVLPDLTGLQKEDYYNVRGNIWMALGKFDSALADFDKCIQLNSTFTLAYVNKAIAKLNKPEHKQARTIMVSGNANDKILNPSWVLPDKNADKISETVLRDALADCDMAIAIDSKFGYGYYVRAQVKQLLKLDFCGDVFIATELGFHVDEILKATCK
jgi:tetratricopeptide (TPR) repeat protein